MKGKKMVKKGKKKEKMTFEKMRAKMYKLE